MYFTFILPHVFMFRYGAKRAAQSQLHKAYRFNPISLKELMLIKYRHWRIQTQRHGGKSHNQSDLFQERSVTGSLKQKGKGKNPKRQNSASDYQLRSYTKRLARMILLERLQDTEKMNCYRKEGTHSLNTKGGGHNWTHLKHPASLLPQLH